MSSESGSGYHDALQVQIIERLTRMETKLDAFQSSSADHESRIRGLERAKWMIVGGATVLGGSAGAVVSELLNR